MDARDEYVFVPHITFASSKNSLSTDSRKIFDEFSEYLDEIYAPDSIRGFLMISSPFLHYLDENAIPLSKVTPQTIRDYFVFIAPNRPKSMDNVVFGVRVFLRFLYECQYIDWSSEMMAFRIPPSRKKVPVAYTDNEIQTILESIDISNATGKRDYAIIVMSLLTGLRSVDIRNLKREYRPPSLTSHWIMKICVYAALKRWLTLAERRGYMAKKKFYGFHSGFAELLNNFIQHKRSLGYVEDSYFHLNSFDAFCADKYPDAYELTPDIVTEWCAISDKGIINRCSQIREFAKYLISMGKPAYIYPAAAIPKRTDGLPYIISQHEQSRFFEATDNMVVSKKSPLMEYTAPVVFRLMLGGGQSQFVQCYIST